MWLNQNHWIQKDTFFNKSTKGITLYQLIIFAWSISINLIVLHSGSILFKYCS